MIVFLLLWQPWPAGPGSSNWHSPASEQFRRLPSYRRNRVAGSIRNASRQSHGRSERLRSRQWETQTTSSCPPPIPEVNAVIHAQSKTIGLEPLFNGWLMLRSNICVRSRLYRQNAKRSNAPTTQAART